MHIRTSISKQAFTMVEILIGIAIIFLIGAIQVGYHVSSLQEIELENKAVQIKNLVHLARTRAHLQYQNQDWSIIFLQNAQENDAVTVFKGNDYVNRDQNEDIKLDLGTKITIQSINLNNSDKITFIKRSAASPISGSIILGNGTDQTLTLNLNPYGVVNID